MAGPMLNRASPVAVCLAAFAALAFAPEAMGQTPVPPYNGPMPQHRLAPSSVELPEWVMGIGSAVLLMFLWIFLGFVAGGLRDAYTVWRPREPDRAVGYWPANLGLAFGLFGVIVVALDTARPLWVSP